MKDRELRSNKPLVSVLMATYNTPNEWLLQAINSILTQTYEAFELIIVDDCSTTNVEEVQNLIGDDRVIWVKNETNLGLTKSLNKALKIAKGTYIARMDADDISLPERFAVQLAYMEKHPEVIVCGSYRRAFGAENCIEAWNIPKTREEQQIQLFFFNCGLTHPTAMFRKALLDEYGITYNESYKKAQDYGIWVQCTRFAPMAMIRQVLLEYRKSDRQVTSDKKGVNLYDSMVKTDQLLSLGLICTEAEKEMHALFCRYAYYPEADGLYAWIKRLEDANKKVSYFRHKAFVRVLRRRWYLYCKLQREQSDAYDPYYRQAATAGDRMQDLVIEGKRKAANVINRIRNSRGNGR